MLTRMTTTKKLAAIMLTGLFLLLLPANGNACRMYAAIGYDLPNGMLFDHLRGDTTNFPYALYYLSNPPPPQTINDDGWGIGYYPEFGAIPSIDRGEPMAQIDPNFLTAVTSVNASEPAITMAHVRKGTTGCDNVPNPHPFYRDKIGKRWLFEHNGGVTKSHMYTLLGNYIDANPPNGSDIPECASGVVDSELYFLFVLKKIEEKGWNTVNGIAAAIRAMIAAPNGETGAINFIMSDGESIWAFRRDNNTTHPLHYLYDAANGYSAVASQYPSAGQGSWISMTNYKLVVLTRDAAPVVINDVRNYCPGDLPADLNNDGQVNASDVAALALNFGGSGLGDLDSDGDVDGADLAALVAAYGSRCP